MKHDQQYIGGSWVPSTGGQRISVENPATREQISRIASGTGEDVNAAVAAAVRARDSFARTTLDERRAILNRILDRYELRKQEIAEAVIAEVGCPRTISEGAQVRNGVNHLRNSLDALDRFAFSSTEGTSTSVYDSIGVVALITPWNWPIHQIMSKVAYAIAAGCTMVLKPSEIAPINALILADIIHESGLPAGVFNLVNGTGDVVGAELSAHPDVDMVSFTGSTRAGGLVAAAAAPTIKRVAQELGGKSANIVLDGPGFVSAVEAGVRAAFVNSGQSCTAPTRMLVPASRLAETEEVAARAAAAMRTGDPTSAETELGPLVSKAQYDRVQEYIEIGVDEGARIISGGRGNPTGLESGWYVRPTVFSDVRPDMRIATEEIFGPALVILPYGDEDEAVALANDSEYGLTAYVSGEDLDHARSLGSRLRAGQVRINFSQDSAAAFGGVRRSGNGREMGVEGLKEYLELKVIIG